MKLRLLAAFVLGLALAYFWQHKSPVAPVVCPQPTGLPELTHAPWPKWRQT